MPKNLLILTAGQTDVQLVDYNPPLLSARKEFHKDNCARMHSELETRGDWTLNAPPADKAKGKAESLPSGSFQICTPKLDAVLDYCQNHSCFPDAALILATRRDEKKNDGRYFESGDPIYAGEILKKRLIEKGLSAEKIIEPVYYLKGKERLEDRKVSQDANIRRAVVQIIDTAIKEQIEAVKPSRVVVAATGGLPIVCNLVEDIVRLYGPSLSGAKLSFLDIPDAAKSDSPLGDKAVERKRETDPLASYQARRHALELIEKGNLIAAWGAVQHLADDPAEQHWIKVVRWLYHFAASLPMPDDYKPDEIGLLDPQLIRAEHAAIRVELALRSGNIPSAVHGTVAFFECALWDHLDSCIEQHPSDRVYRPRSRTDALFYPLVKTPIAYGPFEEDNRQTGWYRVHDDDRGGIEIAENYLKKPALIQFGKTISNKYRRGFPNQEIYGLRNDIAHNEPTRELIDTARQKMQGSGLWSKSDTFLTQDLVKNVLTELGEDAPETILDDLIADVRKRLLNL
jgi:hypothetical protein